MNAAGKPWAPPDHLNAVPAVLRLIGGRLYHVITDYDLYFAPGKDPMRPTSGTGSASGGDPPGALGVVGGPPPRPVAVAPSFVSPDYPARPSVRTLGQLLQPELFGAPTDLPWAHVTPYDNGALRPGMVPGAETYHPTPP